MADLITTKAEREMNSFLDWDDASLGQYVKKIAVNAKHCELETLRCSAGAVLLVTVAMDNKAKKITQTVEGITDGDVPIGDWKITVEKLSDVKPLVDARLRKYMLQWQDSQGDWLTMDAYNVCKDTSNEIAAKDTALADLVSARLVNPGSKLRVVVETKTSKTELVEE